MTDTFFKYPSTPHLAAPGHADLRQDKLLTDRERNELLSHPLLIEEKVDGANLGISFDRNGVLRLQNRGSYLCPTALTGQWKKLAIWIEPRCDVLFDVLGTDYILFGEWCYACHSVKYQFLPDWFLGFDIHVRKEGYFLDSQSRDALFKKMNIIPVPVVARGNFSLEQLRELPAQSKLGTQPAEGLYLRTEEDGRLTGRAKLVRSDFLQTDAGHWRDFVITANTLVDRRDNPG